MDFLFSKHRKLLAILFAHKVNFMLIGGYSVIYYGYSRGTGDMDIWLKPDNENKMRFLEALKIFGINHQDVERVGNLDFTKTSMFFIGKAPDKIDFLTKVQNVSWEEAIPRMNIFQFEDLKIPIVGFDELILMKMATDRMKDKADVEELQRIRKAAPKKPPD